MIKNILTNIIIPMIAIIGIGMAIYTSIVEDPRILENQKIVDSLRLEVQRYEKRHDSLISVIKNLDVEISTQERVIDSLMKRKPEPPGPVIPPKPSEAKTILDNFRKG